MKKNTLLWITGIILFAAAILFVPSMFIFGRSNWDQNYYGMMSGYGGFGMMGSGWTSFGWLIPIIIMILVVAGGVMLGNSISNQNNTQVDIDDRTCPNCNKTSNADWITCPHCSTSLE